MTKGVYQINTAHKVQLYGFCSSLLRTHLFNEEGKPNYYLYCYVSIFSNDTISKVKCKFFYDIVDNHKLDQTYEKALLNIGDYLKLEGFLKNDTFIVIDWSVEQ